MLLGDVTCPSLDMDIMKWAEQGLIPSKAHGAAAERSGGGLSRPAQIDRWHHQVSIAHIIASRVSAAPSTPRERRPAASRPRRASHGPPGPADRPQELAMETRLPAAPSGAGGGHRRSAAAGHEGGGGA